MPAVDPTEYGGPKRPTTALFAYGNTARAKIIADLKKKETEGGEKFAVTKVAGILANNYKALPEAERKKYETQYVKDKDAYNKKMEVWKKTEQYQEYMKESAAKRKSKSDSKSGGASKKALKALVPDSMPKRPANALFAFSGEKAAEITAACKAAGRTDIKARQEKLQELWKKVSDADKKKREADYKKKQDKYQEDMKAWKLTDEAKEYEEKKKQLKKDSKKAGNSSPVSKKRKVAEDEEEASEELSDEDDEEEEEE